MDHGLQFTISSWVAVGGLIFLLVWIRGDPARGRRRCPKCWYDLRATTEPRCPECGFRFTRERQLRRTRRRLRPLMLGMITILVGAGSAIYPLFKSDWPTRMPDTVLILALPTITTGTDSVALEVRARMLPSPKRGVRRKDLTITENLWGWQRRLLVSSCDRILLGKRLGASPFAIEILGLMGSDAVGALRGLSAALDVDGDEDMLRNGVLSVLTDLGPAAAPALPAILRDLERRLANRASLSSSLARATGHDDITYDRDDEGSFYADSLEGSIAIIIALGSRASRSLPVLSSMLTDTSMRVQLLALSALRAIGPHADQPCDQLAALARTGRSVIRFEAMQAMTHLAPLSEITRGAAEVGIRDPETQLRTAAADALRADPHGLSHVLRDLRGEISSGDRATRVAAARAIMTLGPSAKSAWSELETARHDSMPLVRVFSVRAMLNMIDGNQQRDAVLHQAMHDDDALVRRIAIDWAADSRRANKGQASP